MLNLMFSAAFVIQLVHLFPNYVQPDQLNTVMEIVKLKQLEEFPLVFKVCLRPGFNMTVLANHGYFTTDQYFWGTNDFGWAPSDVGWAGKNGSVNPAGNNQMQP